LNNWIVDQQREGIPVRMGSFSLTPISRAFIIQIPGLHGGLVWNRPSAVVITRADGSQQWVPVMDVTRLTLFGIAALTVMTAILAGILIGKDTK
jgi:hypothetical protein